MWQKQEVLPSILFQERTAFKTGLGTGLVLLPDGGESGIRTPGTLLTLACFLDKFLKPYSDNSPKQEVNARHFQRTWIKRCKLAALVQESGVA